MSLWTAVVLIVLIATLGEALARRYDASRRAELPPGPGERELAELRERVEVLVERVDRLSEEQRFLTRLLEERPAPPDHSKSEEAV